MKVGKENEIVVVNEEFIKLGESGNGGWNKKQLAILGIDWPPEKGWKQRSYGKVISYSDAVTFVELTRIKKNEKEKLKSKIKKKGSAPIFVKVRKKLSWAEQYRHPNWQKLRLIILNRDNFTCCKCGDNQSQLHVHHLRYDKNKNIWGVRHADLITLCENCHLKEHNKNSFESDKKTKSKIKKR